VDIMLLRRCDQLVITPGSTFGYLAYAAAGIAPFAVRRNPYLARHAKEARATETCTKLSHDQVDSATILKFIAMAAELSKGAPKSKECFTPSTVQRMKLLYGM